jgi:hypothetical protein
MEPTSKRISYHDFCDLVELLVRQHDASVTSWWRTEKHNEAVGGGVASDHLAGFAVDLVLDNSSGYARMAAHARSLGLDAAYEGDHLHIEADKRTR